MYSPKLVLMPIFLEIWHFFYVPKGISKFFFPVIFSSICYLMKCPCDEIEGYALQITAKQGKWEYLEMKSQTEKGKIRAVYFSPKKRKNLHNLKVMAKTVLSRIYKKGI